MKLVVLLSAALDRLSDLQFWGLMLAIIAIALALAVAAIVHHGSPRPVEHGFEVRRQTNRQVNRRPRP